MPRTHWLTVGGIFNTRMLSEIDPAHTSPRSGAVYYYNTEVNKTYQQTIVDVFKYAQESGIPYRTWLADSWWYPKDSKDAVTEWIAMPSIFPDGFEFLYNTTGWKSISHNR